MMLMLNQNFNCVITNTCGEIGRGRRDTRECVYYKSFIGLLLKIISYCMVCPVLMRLESHQKMKGKTKKIQ